MTVPSLLPTYSLSQTGSLSPSDLSNSTVSAVSKKGTVKLDPYFENVEVDFEKFLGPDYHHQKT